jgi:hypothetical protein
MDPNRTTRSSIDREAEHLASPTRSEDKLHKYFGIPQSHYRVLSPSPERQADHITNNVSHQPSTQRSPEYQRSIDTDRPDTRQSAKSARSVTSTEDHSSFGSHRMGSVKKRLSLLGIGKKPSKASVKSGGRGGGVESLVEE